MNRPIHLIVVIIAIFGGVLAFKQQHKSKILADEFKRLSTEFGNLEIDDESKYHVAFVGSEGDKFFRWRAYYPAGLGLKTECDSPNGSTGSGAMTRSLASTEIVTCAFRFEPKRVLVYVGNSGSGSTLMSIGTGLVTPFVKEHWDELEFKVLAEENVAVLGADDMLTFLEITIPESLADQMVEELGSMSKRYRKRVFRLRIGTQTAFVKQP